MRFELLSSSSTHSGGGHRHLPGLFTIEDTEDDGENDLSSPSVSSSSSPSPSGSHCKDGVAHCDTHDVDRVANIPAGQSSVGGASMNFINSIVGAGIVGIPLALQQSGFLPGVLLLLCVALLVRESVVMLVDCGRRRSLYHLEELCEALLGERGFYVAIASMFLFAYGGQVAYLVILGDTLPVVLRFLSSSSSARESESESESGGWGERETVMAVCAVSVILPLSLLRDLSHLAWTSSLSILIEVVLILVVLFASLSATRLQDTHIARDDFLSLSLSLSLFSAIGTMSFAFVCQHNSFLVFQSLAVPSMRNWSRVANISISASFALSLSLGLIGLIAFFPYVQGDLLNNFPASYASIAVARALLAVSMLLTYPMECYVARHCVCVLWQRMRERNTRETARIEGDRERNRERDRELWSAKESAHCEMELCAVRETHHEMESERDRERQSDNDDVEVVLNPQHTHNAFTQHTHVSHTHSTQTKIPHNTLSHVDADNNVLCNSHTEHTHRELDEERDISLSQHVGITLAIWATTLAIALSVRKLGVVSALTGAGSASTLGYTLPGLIYIQTFREEHADMLASLRRLLSRHTHKGHVSLRDEEDAHSPTSLSAVEENDVSLWDVCCKMRRFVLPYFMVCFGVITLTVGVLTIVFASH